MDIPDLKDIFKDRPAVAKFSTIGDVVSGLLNIFFYIAGFLAFYYLVWGAIAYIMAKGEKEGLAKARERIRWAIIGLLVIFMAYFIATYASEIFLPKGGLPF